jgi:YtxH-like protein
MRAFGTRYTPKEWARLAMKVGLLVTDAKLVAALNRRIHEHTADMGDMIRGDYDQMSEQLRVPRVQFRSHTDWFARVTSLLAGIGIGISVGMLIAPSSGEETRANLRARVNDVKNSVGDVASRATRARSTSDVRSTGTVGD